MTKRPPIMNPIKLILIVLTLLTLQTHADEDILLADFENETYAQWKPTGQAFGKLPAPGALPGQMKVDGYLGKGLVNSFNEGDKTTGSLTSPPFTINRTHLNFLIGGGNHPNQTQVQLIINNKITHRATGKDSENLSWHTFNLKDHQNQTAQIKIIDTATGGWGHINADHFLLSNTPKVRNLKRTLEINKSYLLLPVKNGAPKKIINITLKDQTVRAFNIELAPDQPDTWYYLYTKPFLGQTLTLHAHNIESKNNPLEQIKLADHRPDHDNMYNEPARPAFHFTSYRGWLNDPNGLVYYQGKWHLFYQHNPYGWNWGNMHWGHATSKDLFHWTQHPIAIYPHQYGDWAFSGGAVIDHNNTSGFQTGTHPPMVLFYTSTGRGESLQYSTDGGKTFNEYKNNPVIKHKGRDPKVIWHEPTKRWILFTYTETDNKQSIAFYSSNNLRDWKYESRNEGWFECPDFFQAPIDNDPNNTTWVLYAADAQYVLGDFDGHKFTPKTKKLKLWHGNFYAAQSYDNAPDNRRVQIGWYRGSNFPNQPFNQQMSVPVELTLRNTHEGVRMFAEPVKELYKLRGPTTKVKLDTFTPDTPNPLHTLTSHTYDIVLSCDLASAKNLKLKIRDTHVSYDIKSKTLTCGNTKAYLHPMEGKLHLRILVDKGSVEVFGNHGRVALAHTRVLKDEGYALSTQGGSIKNLNIEAYPIKSTWKQ